MCQLAKLRIRGFGARPEIDEDANQQEEGVREEQAQQDKEAGNDVTEESGDSCRAEAAHSHRKDGAKRPAAVHWKRRQKIEEGEKEVRRCEARQKGPQRGTFDRLGCGKADQDDQDRAKGDAHRWSGNRHGELLCRAFRHALHSADAPDREQKDVPSAATIMPRNEHMSELMGDDTGEQEQDEEGPGDCRLSPPGKRLTRRDPEQQDQEREMHPHLRAEDGGDRD